MLVISSREFRANQGKYLGMAADGEDIVLKSRGQGSFKLVPITEDDTLKNIPKEYRCDPYKISPSGDSFWADQRNVDKLAQIIADHEAGKSKIVAVLNPGDNIEDFIKNI